MWIMMVLRTSRDRADHSFPVTTHLAPLSMACFFNILPLIAVQPGFGICSHHKAPVTNSAAMQSSISILWQIPSRKPAGRGWGRWPRCRRCRTQVLVRRCRTQALARKMVRSCIRVFEGFYTYQGSTLVVKGLHKNSIWGLRQSTWS